MIQTIGIYGGSFNPIHLGHIEKIKRLDALCHFNELFFLPCGEHAFKEKTTISKTHRIEMLNIALADFHFKIDPQELERKGKSYTIETLQQYRKNYGHDVSLSFIMGHDAFCDFMQWQEFTSILNHAHIILLSRPHNLCEFSQDLSNYLLKHQSDDLNLISQKSGGYIFDVKEKDYPYSSTEIREYLQAQKKPLGLDPRVYAYIQKHQLYC